MLLQPGQPRPVHTDEPEHLRSQHTAGVVPLGLGQRPDAREVLCLKSRCRGRLHSSRQVHEGTGVLQGRPDTGGIELQDGGHRSGLAGRVAHQWGPRVDRPRGQRQGQLLPVAIEDGPARGRQLDGPDALSPRQRSVGRRVVHLELDEPDEDRRQSQGQRGHERHQPPGRGRASRRGAAGPRAAPPGHRGRARGGHGFAPSCRSTEGRVSSRRAPAAPSLVALRTVMVCSSAGSGSR